MNIHMEHDATYLNIFSFANALIFSGKMMKEKNIAEKKLHN